MIILTGGGSGGHITPLLSLAQELKKQKPTCKIIYIGLKGDKVEGLQGKYQVFDEVRHIAAGKFRRYHGQDLVANLRDVKTQALNSRDFFRVIKGLHSAESIIKAAKPDVVFSKGGYVAVPVGLAARLHGVPIVTHDSDVVPGLANRILGRWAAVRASGLPVESITGQGPAAVHTGIPVDDHFKPVTAAAQRSFKKDLDLPADSLVLLAAGGGLGSQQINELMLAISPKLLKRFPKLRVFHFAGIGLAGQQSVAEVMEAYRKLLSAADQGRVEVLDFSDQFYRYSGAADLIISRAGATAISEFAAQAKACVIIPSAVLSGGHQLKNADLLAERQAAVVLPADVKSPQLLDKVSKLLDNSQQRQTLAKNLGRQAEPKAAAKLAALVLATAGEGGH